MSETLNEGSGNPSLVSETFFLNKIEVNNEKNHFIST